MVTIEQKEAAIGDMRGWDELTDEQKAANEAARSELVHGQWYSFTQPVASVPLQHRFNKKHRGYQKEIVFRIAVYLGWSEELKAHLFDYLTKITKKWLTCPLFMCAGDTKSICMPTMPPPHAPAMPSQSKRPQLKLIKSPEEDSKNPSQQ